VRGFALPVTMYKEAIEAWFQTLTRALPALTTAL